MTASLTLHAICWTALFASLLQIKRLPIMGRCFFVIGFFCLGFLPLNDIALVAYPLGVLSDLSITTAVLSALALIRLFRPNISFTRRDYAMLWWSIPVIALFFYPASLGLIYFDPYQYGYQPQALMLLLLPITLLLWWLKNYLFVLIVLIALWCFNCQLIASNNLWDYLIDPILVFYCLFQLRACGSWTKRPSRWDHVLFPRP